MKENDPPAFKGAERTAEGTPVQAGTEIAEEAKWLISVRKAWKRPDAAGGLGDARDPAVAT